MEKLLNLLLRKLKNVFNKDEPSNKLRQNLPVVDQIDSVVSPGDAFHAYQHQQSQQQQQHQKEAAARAAEEEKERQKREFKREAYALDHFLHIADNEELMGLLFFIINGEKADSSSDKTVTLDDMYETHTPADAVPSADLVDGHSEKSTHDQVMLPSQSATSEAEYRAKAAIDLDEEPIGRGTPHPYQLPEPKVQEAEPEIMPPPQILLKRGLSRKGTIRLLKFWAKDANGDNDENLERLNTTLTSHLEVSNSTLTNSQSTFARFRTLSTRDLSRGFGKLKRVGSQDSIAGGPLPPRMSKLKTRSHGLLLDSQRSHRTVTPTRDRYAPKVPLPLENKVDVAQVSSFVDDSAEMEQQTPSRKNAPEAIKRELSLKRKQQHPDPVPVEIFRTNGDPPTVAAKAIHEKSSQGFENPLEYTLAHDIIDVDDYNSDVLLKNLVTDDEDEQAPSMANNKRGNSPDKGLNSRPTKKAMPTGPIITQQAHSRELNVGHVYHQLQGQASRQPSSTHPIHYPSQSQTRGVPAPTAAPHPQSHRDPLGAPVRMLPQAQAQLMQFYNQQYATQHYQQPQLASAYTYGTALAYGPQLVHVMQHQQHYQVPQAPMPMMNPQAHPTVNNPGYTPMPFTGPRNTNLKYSQPKKMSIPSKHQPLPQSQPHPHQSLKPKETSQEQLPEPAADLKPIAE